MAHEQRAERRGQSLFSLVSSMLDVLPSLRDGAYLCFAQTATFKCVVLMVMRTSRPYTVSLGRL